jgi:YfiH family protein
MQQHDFNSVPYFTFDSLAKGQQHAIFTRLGGVSQSPFASLNLSSSVADDAANLPINRGRAYGVLGRSEETLVHAHLVHRADVARVTRANQGQVIPKVDALITNEVGCGLAMNYADCAPIFLYDPINSAIGLGHAGWAGTVLDVAGAMVRAMVQEFGSEVGELVAGIGPCIHPCCYEVDEPVIGQVRANFEQPNQLLIPQVGKNRPHFDMVAANRQNLLRAGVVHIEESGLCTACRTDLFFSHRAEKGRTGRFGTVFVLQ